jgi:glucosamine 6-phosphate synthetase-like amidotransferase/phosphosugar isomerase protein
VVLGGFEKAKEELVLIQNLVIASKGNSLIASKYGALLMKHLQVFNTVKCVGSDELGKSNIDKIKYGGFLTLSQSGDDKNLIQGLINATRSGVTCINVVNVEDSPITRVIQEI